MRQLFAVLLICSVACAGASSTVLTDADDFARGFFESFGADISECLGQTELAQIAQKFDDIKNDFSSGTFFQKLLHAGEDVYGLSELLKQQGQQCDVVQIAELFKNFDATVKADGGIKNLIPVIMQEHMMDVIGAIRQIAEGIKGKDFQSVGVAFGQLWQALFDAVQSSSFENFNEDTITAFMRALQANIFQDAEAFAHGFFGGFGANPATCLDDSDVQNIINAFNNIKAALAEKGVAKYITLAENVYTFAQDLRAQLKNCDVMTIENEVKSFMAALKADGAKKVLLAFAEEHFQAVFSDAKDIFVGLKDHDYETIGSASGNLLSDLLKVGTPTMTAFASTTPTALTDAKQFLEGFFTNFGANVDTCVSTSDLESMKSALDEIKAAVSAHGLVHKIEGVIMGVESLASLLKAQAQACGVTSLTATITKFITEIKTEGVGKVALEAVLHHGLSLVADGKDIYQGIKTQNYNEIGMATGAILNDIADDAALVVMRFAVQSEDSEIASDAKTLLQGFFNAWGANINTCLSNADYKKFVSLVESVRSAWTASNTSIVERLEKTVISVYAAWDLIQSEAQECDITKVATQVSAFEAAVKANGLEKTLLPALKNHMMDLIQDGEQVVQGLKSHNFELIGQAVGNVIRDVTDVPAPSMTFAAATSADVSDARELLQGFFNAWGSNIETCLSNSYLQQFADALNNVKTAWESGSITERLEKTVLSLYSAWNLLKSEAQQCDVTKIATQLAHFEAAVKANGVEKTVLPALKNNMMDIIQDAEQIMQGMKTKNFELLGQAFGNIVREITNVPASSMYFAAATPSDVSDARELLQGFFNAWGANIETCLSNSYLQQFADALNNVKTAWESGSITERVEKTVLSLYSAWNLLKSEAQQCNVTKIATQLAHFEAAVKANGVEKTVLPALKNNMMDFIQDAEQIMQGMKTKNFELLGQVFGNIVREITDVPAPSMTFAAVSPATTDAQDFAQGFFSAFGADVSQCLDNADMQKIATQLEDIKKAIKGDPVVALIKVVEDIKEILGEFKSEATACDVTSVEAVVKELVAAAKKDGVEKFVLTALLEHGLNMLENVKAGIDSFKAQDYEGAGKAIGNVIIDLKPNPPSQSVAGFLA